jgi:hypothetical protein
MSCALRTIHLKEASVTSPESDEIRRKETL